MLNIYIYTNFQAGPSGGNIYMTPGANGTVYIGHTDMLRLFEV